MAWSALPSRDYPHLLEVERELSRRFDLVRLRSVAETTAWAAAHPRGRLVLRSPLQHDESVHRAIAEHSLVTLNTLEALQVLADRTRLFARLAHTDIPFPRGSDLGAGYIVRGRQAVTHVWARSETPEDDDTVFSQPFIENDGTDLKVYVLAEHAWAFRCPSKLSRASSARGRDRSLYQPAPITDALKRITESIRHRLGLEIFGCDLVTDREGRPWVVDINSFPSMERVPGIGALQLPVITRWLQEPPRA